MFQTEIKSHNEMTLGNVVFGGLYEKITVCYPLKPLHEPQASINPSYISLHRFNDLPDLIFQKMHDAILPLLVY